MSDVKQRPIKASADANDWLVVQSDDAGLGDERRVRVGAVGGGYEYAPVGLIRELGAVDSFDLDNHTFQTNYLLPYKPVAIQFGFYGHGADAITGCKAGYNFSSDAISTGASALQMSTINAITFSGASTFTLPARVASDLAINTQLSLILSDLMPIDSAAPLARNDGKSGYIIATRLFQPGVGAGLNVTRTTVVGIDAKSFETGGYIKYGYKSSDAIATPNTTMTVGNIGCACVLIVHYAENVRTIYTIGDSITQGYGSAALHHAYGAARYYSKSKIDAGEPVNICSYANSGMDSKTYLANFLNHIDTLQYGATAVFSPYSPNDNGGVINEQIYLATIAQNINKFVTACKKRLITPVLLTPTPIGSASLGTENSRRKFVALVKDMATAYGIKIIDRDSIYTDYSVSTGGFKSGLNSDLLHPSAAGYAAEAVEWLAVLK